MRLWIPSKHIWICSKQSAFISCGLITCRIARDMRNRILEPFKKNRSQIRDITIKEKLFAKRQHIH